MQYFQILSIFGNCIVGGRFVATVLPLRFSLDRWSSDITTICATEKWLNRSFENGDV